MYELLAIDSILRITLALAFFFVLVPRLAWPRSAESGALQRFWWDFAVGLTLLTLYGQLLTLAKLYALPTLLLLCAAVIFFGRAAYHHRSPAALAAIARRWTVVATINILDGRVSLRRRFRRMIRRARRRLNARFATAPSRLLAIAWLFVFATAAVFRLYRPFVTANLGFSDSYVHLYLLKLLEEGSQVDPSWGPYPRGMHFLLLAIQRLTNIDDILLVNFFGAFVGILITLGVATAARRLSRSNVGGLLGTLLFATMIGGASQYFILGGSFESHDLQWARSMTAVPYAAVPKGAGEYDALLIAFQRQTSTLSQELAIAFLFPAVVFLLDALRRRRRWDTAGFAACTAAIAATHSGVLVPLLLLSMVVALAVIVSRVATLRDVARQALAGAAAIVVGSTWMFGFILYRHAGGQAATSASSHVGSTALFYFPFLAPLTGNIDSERLRSFNSFTPFLAVCLAVSLLLIVLAFGGVRRRRPERIIASLAFVLFLSTHVAYRIGLPEIVESRRNVIWLAMSIAVLLAVGITEVGRALRRLRVPRRQALTFAGTVAVVVPWLILVPPPASLRSGIVNYSGYGSAALAVVKIAHTFEPYSWTLVSYGQEFPMVLGRGYAIPAADFLQRYDPLAPTLAIPTPNVFVMLERVPHEFEVNDWKAKFSRREIEKRLDTWCALYRGTHGGVRVFLDDGNVQVLQISRSESEARRIAAGEGR